MLTDYGNSDSVDYNARCREELKLSLESSGPCKVTSLKNYLLVFNACYKRIYIYIYVKLSLGNFQVAFNPVTTNSMKKILFRICQVDQCDMTAEYVDLIAKTSGGDITHITSLQFLYIRDHNSKVD